MKKTHLNRTSAVESDSKQVEQWLNTRPDSDKKQENTPEPDRTGSTLLKNLRLWKFRETFVLLFSYVCRHFYLFRVKNNLISTVPQKYMV